MIFRFGNYEIDDSGRELRAAGQRVETEPRAFALLLYLLQNRDRAVSKDELLTAVWPQSIVSDTALTRCIMKARRAVGDDSDAQSVIRTVHGHGYHFVAEVEEVEHSPAATPAIRNRKPSFIALAATAVVALAAVAWLLVREPSLDLDEGRLAVLPVQNATGDADLDWAGYGLMSLMQKVLDDAGVKVATDRSVTSAVSGFDLSMPPGAELLKTVGARSNAAAVLHATLDRSGGLHRLTTVITHIDGTRVRRVIVGDSPAEIAANMASVVAGMMTESLPVERVRSVSTDPFVNELYARALDMELRGDLVEARDMFRLAVAQEPELFWLRYEIALCTRDLREYDEADSMFADLLEEALANNDSRAIVATLNSQAVMKFKMNNYDDAEAILLRARDYAEERTLTSKLPTILVNQALIDSRQGNEEQSKQHYEEAMAVYEQLDEVPAPTFFNNYAGLLIRLGDLDTAIGFSERAIEGFRLRGQRRFEAPALNRMAKILRRKGELEEAIKRHQEAQQIYAELDDLGGELSVLSGLTVVYREMGDLTRARLTARDVLERAPQTGEPELVANSHIQAAYVESNLGNHEMAIPEFERAADLFEDMNNGGGYRASQMGIALSSIALERTGQAHDIGQVMLEDAVDRNSSSSEARAHWLLGKAALADKDFETAATHFNFAYDYAQEKSDRIVLVYAASGLAELHMDNSQLDAASERLDEIRELAASEHGFHRLDARLASLLGDTDRAIEILTGLRGRAGEAWLEEDEAMLAELRN